jgi:hypothetical protein
MDVVLVEESVSESALACIAIALRRPGTRVAEARSLKEATSFVQTDSPGPLLVILGSHALQQPLAPFIAAIGERAAVVALANGVSQAGRERALRAGLRAIYERPQEWRPFCDVLEKVLDECLGARVRP